MLNQRRHPHRPRKSRSTATLTECALILARTVAHQALPTMQMRKLKILGEVLRQNADRDGLDGAG